MEAHRERLGYLDLEYPRPSMLRERSYRGSSYRSPFIEDEDEYEDAAAERIEVERHYFPTRWDNCGGYREGCRCGKEELGEDLEERHKELFHTPRDVITTRTTVQDMEVTTHVAAIRRQMRDASP